MNFSRGVGGSLSHLWKFRRGGGVLSEIPSVVGVWIFSGTTHSMLRTLCSDTKINILNPNLDVKMFIKGVQTYLESIFSVPFVPNKKMLWLALKTLKV